jgi:hypothetical protein
MSELPGTYTADRMHSILGSFNAAHIPKGYEHKFVSSESAVAPCSVPARRRFITLHYMQIVRPQGFVYAASQL